MKKAGLCHENTSRVVTNVLLQHDVQTTVSVSLLSQKRQHGHAVDTALKSSLRLTDCVTQFYLNRLPLPPGSFSTLWNASERFRDTYFTKKAVSRYTTAVRFKVSKVFLSFLPLGARKRSYIRTCHSL